MHLAFDIFQGIGIATAVGIRPFLPAFAAGALAAAGVELGYAHTTFTYLSSAPVLFALAIAGFALLAAERGLGDGSFNRRAAMSLLALLSFAIAGFYFAGDLAHSHHSSWPGFPAGILCAAVGLLATRPLFARVRARLDAEAASAVSLYAEGGATLLAALSVLAPPVGPLGLLALLWLLAGSRRRASQKYAGLRILR